MPFPTKKLKILLIFILSISLIFCLSGCGSEKGDPNEKKTVQGFFLDTVVELTVYGNVKQNVLDDCLQLCAKYELVFSRTDPQSELYALNKNGGGKVGDELRDVLSTALSYCEASGGRFDITLGAVSDMYGFSSDFPSLPPADAIAEAMTHVGYEKISLDGSTVTFADPETVIDLGAIAKGYIADRMKDFLISKGVKNAMINLGGNVLCVGEKPDGSDFRIGVKMPVYGSEDIIQVINLKDMSVVTSGVYERCFIENGVSYHHILDSGTGYSIRNGLASVTIVSPKSVDGDALSTTVFALGLENGMHYVNSLEGVYAMFVDDDLNMYYSEGFADNFLK